MSIMEDGGDQTVRSSFCLGGHVPCLLDALWVNTASSPSFVSGSHMHNHFVIRLFGVKAQMESQFVTHVFMGN